MKGRLITFEGCEGVGKTTQIEMLKEYLSKHNIPFVFTREPGGTKTGNQIRSILMDKSLMDMYDETELLLFEASRLENTRSIIKPALEQGKLVVVDRYIHSTIAYQAYGRGLDRKMIDLLNAYAMDGVKIDLTIFIDKPAFSNTERNASDRVELAGEEFHKKVYDGFKALEKETDNFIAIKTREDKLDTQNDIINLLKVRGII